MNIGILQCDEVEEELRPVFGHYPTMFTTLLKLNPDLEFKVYNVERGELPKTLVECDAYLITGSRHGVNDELPWIAELEHFVRAVHASKIKLIGICFGHQIVAKALGGKVIKSPKGWGVGTSVNTILQKKSWMNPSYDRMHLLVSHQDQVVELPENAEVLASNHHCPFYMLQIENHLVTVQGHPEFSKDYSKALIEKRKQSLGTDCYENGINSLQLEIHDSIFAQWMINFLYQTPQ